MPRPIRETSTAELVQRLRSSTRGRRGDNTAPVWKGEIVSLVAQRAEPGWRDFAFSVAEDNDEFVLARVRALRELLSDPGADQVRLRDVLLSSVRGADAFLRDSAIGLVIDELAARPGLADVVTALLDIQPPDPKRHQMTLLLLRRRASVPAVAEILSRYQGLQVPETPRTVHTSPAAGSLAKIARLRLVTMSQSRRKGTEEEAIELIQSLIEDPLPEAYDLLIAILSSGSDELVVIEALKALREMPPFPAVSGALRRTILESEYDDLVRVYAAQALFPYAAHPLVQRLALDRLAGQDENAEVKYALLEVLGAAPPTPEAQEILVSLGNDPEISAGVSLVEAAWAQR